MPVNLMNEIYVNFISMGIALLSAVIMYLIFSIIIANRVDSKTFRKRLRIRVFYIISVIMVFVLARIWFEGFTHLLTVLGLVSAALVITNKETIMNFVGWLIITWRGLFAEDDLIHILDHRGYVKSIGLLYFTLLETSATDQQSITGRTIRIPNGLVENHVIINFSQTSDFLEQTCLFIITKSSEIQHAVDIIKESVKNALNDTYKDNNKYSTEYLAKRNKQIAGRFHLETKVTISPKFDKPAGIQLSAQYYCFAKDAILIQQKIWQNALNTIEKDRHVELAFEL